LPSATPTPADPLAPELEGGTGWINSEPLTLEALRGQVVLVNFWTYGCYNCQNTMPHVRAWWDTYAEQGLVIIGVHTPELRWEYPLENVQQAVINEGIGWPVVQDNDKRIWRAYENRYWPRFYLVDHNGRIIYDHIGEGRYEATEQQIVEALAAAEAARQAQ
jgi:thiol-disulfide isomerase/thioredoxin